MKHKSIGQQRRRRNKMILFASVGGVALIACIALAIAIINRPKVTSESEVMEETQIETAVTSKVASETTLPSNTPTPSLSPTPSPTPGPEYLTSIADMEAGTIIDSTLIDIENLGQYFTISEIEEGDEVYQRIYGYSYVDNNDIALSDLRYLKMLHVNFDGNYQVGEMIVNASVATQVCDIFQSMCATRYQIYSMYLIETYWVGNGTDSDTNSIEHNNTSCFCYRPATGGGNLSRHALGLAIDINPQQNPYVTVQADGSYSWSHENASDYVYNRSSDTPHVITESDYAYLLFTTNGWTWGGSWDNPLDYQHFQYN